MLRPGTFFFLDNKNLELLCCRTVLHYVCTSFLSSSLQSKNLKNKIYRLFLYGCETWSLPLREERKLRVFENRMLSP